MIRPLVLIRGGFIVGAFIFSTAVAIAGISFFAIMPVLYSPHIFSSPTNTALTNTTATNTTQLPYASSFAEVLTSKNLTVLNFTAFDNSSLSIEAVSNISINNVMVYNHELILIENESLTVYIPLSNIHVGKNNTVSFVVYGNGYNTTENIIAPLKQISYESFKNITDVEIATYTVDINNESIISYHLINYSPLPIYLQKVVFNNTVLFDQTVKVQPLATWSENFTLSKTINNAYPFIISYVKNQANYTEAINSSAPLLSDIFGF